MFAGFVKIVRFIIFLSNCLFIPSIVCVFIVPAVNSVYPHILQSCAHYWEKPLIHEALKNEDEPPIYTDKAYNYNKMYSYDGVLQSRD